ncbi:Uncharacterized protein FWK35_00003943 [Aphis craccivora]|uniref:Uncharacterized protein n=1 Tax=Aphis craccivora TaxID=307492 RepID=A0A6G0ZH96_APHCR|nr:Uncharacterized protein FWK35_00003943 [Aphis craccivora]
MKLIHLLNGTIWNLWLTPCDPLICLKLLHTGQLGIAQLYYLILHSERSEECIDFTMIITSRNNAPISNYGGGFRCKSEYPWCIIEVKN